MVLASFVLLGALWLLSIFLQFCLKSCRIIEILNITIRRNASFIEHLSSTYPVSQLHMGCAMQNRVFGHMRTAKAQISLRIHAVWSGPSCPLTESFDIKEGRATLHVTYIEERRGGSGGGWGKGGSEGPGIMRKFI